MSTDLMTAQFADTRVLQAIELIWHEAALLDAKDYQAWDALWTDEGRYVIPIDPDTDDFDGSLNMVNDDTRMRRMRIERLTSGYSMSALAAARTVRTVSRFTVEDRSEDSITVRSAQILVGFKRDDQQTLAADVTHRIRYTESGRRLDLKVIRLVNSQAAVNASGYLL
ncbi:MULTISPECIES: aromatic-ring-hydroxylating dioxygenase subunit beta [Rhodococcus]|jgi:3-phenylpropionate/cinnamic acid dioxygenase small subunit|uniref:Aromatic-ring-hydroxylating dioxygenase subunit beta n=1 Tax=Rhodococcus oxybenzonivorans TaxID=1990687 RepID=A0AAE5A863_9NOCA|nr:MULTISPECIES: aromatic-ring-hydroxylating dioxygenase subunit beta [Rhodococcus]MDV7241157.1 aromatic-ring-hydroxylating dioxygenase subunit beta [Rhodococcus oxybenzonivorans]MDV7266394.1 aromatic-ring-hydroxylating dioxygenase subunit beta [Rhodococcus oxybenzonivorans]MDV7273430.1 aromatic-ring-hydroxylating dioxygenase subunit beta [Rhodococcus oxybenzonivorans]MDV7332832.1 aromatic-ring-hydroxylating dioxygenase subunit beta [Rhodococcus oxybenzonivorans]MDV7341998.1 aromatic-ring-hydr